MKRRFILFSHTFFAVCVFTGIFAAGCGTDSVWQPGKPLAKDNDGRIIGTAGKTLSDSEIQSGINWYYHTVVEQ